jgi:hypothetical protein
MRRRRREKKKRAVRPPGFGRAPRKPGKYHTTQKGRRGYSRLRQKFRDRQDLRQRD